MQLTNLDVLGVLTVELFELFVKAHVLVIDVIDGCIRIEHTTTMELFSSFHSEKSNSKQIEKKED